MARVNNITQLLKPDQSLSFSKEVKESPIVDDNTRDSAARVIFSVEDQEGLLKLTNQSALLDFANFIESVDTEFTETDEVLDLDFESLYQESLDTIEDLQRQLADLLAQLDRQDESSEELLAELAKLQLNVVEEFERQVILEEVSNFSSTFFEAVMSQLQNDISDGFFDSSRTVLAIIDPASDREIDDRVLEWMNTAYGDISSEVQDVLSNFVVNEFVLTSKHFRTVVFTRQRRTATIGGGEFERNDSTKIGIDFDQRVSLATGEPCPVTPYIVLEDGIDSETGLSFKSPTLDPNYDTNLLQYQFKRVCYTLLASSISRKAITQIRFGASAKSRDRQENAIRAAVASSFCNAVNARLAQLLDESIAPERKFAIQSTRTLQRTTNRFYTAGREVPQLVVIQDNVQCDLLAKKDANEDFVNDDSSSGGSGSGGGGNDGSSGGGGPTPTGGTRPGNNSSSTSEPSFGPTLPLPGRTTVRRRPPGRPFR